MKEIRANGVFVSYGLSDRFTLEQSTDHVEQAVNWAKKKGVRNEKLILYGESAGASGCIAVLRRGYTASCLVLSSPMVDLARSEAEYNKEENRKTDNLITPQGLQISYMKLLAKNTMQELEDHSPLRISKKDLSCLPPTFISVSPLEIFHNIILDFASKLQDANVKVIVDVSCYLDTND